MTKLFPGITDTAARRLAGIHGDFLALGQQGQREFVHALREARAKGSGVRAIKQRKAKDSNGNDDTSPQGGTDAAEEETQRGGEEELGDAANAGTGGHTNNT